MLPIHPILSQLRWNYIQVLNASFMLLLHFKYINPDGKEKQIYANMQDHVYEKQKWIVKFIIIML